MFEAMTKNRSKKSKSKKNGENFNATDAPKVKNFIIRAVGVIKVFQQISAEHNFLFNRRISDISLCFYSDAVSINGKALL